jgi:hypothetical protein
VAAGVAAAGDIDRRLLVARKGDRPRRIVQRDTHDDRMHGLLPRSSGANLFDGGASLKVPFEPACGLAHQSDVFAGPERVRIA